VTRILVIDNYDSFTYNLVQYLGELGGNPIVHRNDEIDAKACEKLAPDGIVISPGPGNPSDRKYFGVCADVLTGLSKTTPTLGICLGLQGFAHVYGGKVVHAKRVMHGKACDVTHDGRGILRNVPSPLRVGRYHSLAVDEATLPPDLVVTARAEDGEVMGARHRAYPIEGVQFHPESILTPEGKTIIRNFIEDCA
jgi:anthranilate synthase/aminodeoxychorismate synthase-like glutamine amidotransferase